MCPDLLADLEKMLFICGYCPLISLVIVWGISPYAHAQGLDDPSTIPLALTWGVIWTIICGIYYFFAPGHCVICGRRMVFPSRYEQMMHIKTPEEVEAEVEARSRFQSVFDDLKDKGCVDKDRQLDNLLPKVKP